MRTLKLTLAALSIIAAGMGITAAATADELSSPTLNQKPTPPAFEFTIDPLVAGVGEDGADTYSGAGGGVAASFRYFNENDHGLVTSARLNKVDSDAGIIICIFSCPEPKRGPEISLMAGYGYRADFARRPGKNVWFDFTPHVGVQGTHVGGDFDVTLVGANVGIDFNIHMKRDAIIGFLFTYEPMVNVSNGNFASGASLGMRVGAGF